MLVLIHILLSLSLHLRLEQVNEFADRINFYVMTAVANFKSPSTAIRGNAALFAGYMIGHIGKNDDQAPQNALQKEHIVNGRQRTNSHYFPRQFTQSSFICLFFFLFFPTLLAMLKLLKEDPDPKVRSKAAEAISLLKEF